MVENSVPCVLTPAEIEKASAEDMELNFIKECVQTADWSRCNVLCFCMRRMNCVQYGQLPLLGSRLVISENCDHVFGIGPQGTSKYC